MKKELEERLYKQYPELFVRRHLPMSQTCMCWGVCCSDGWFKILQKLCSTIMWYCNKVGRPPPQFEQVKEKMGTLRVYLNSEDAVIAALVTQAEVESEHTCEICGEWGELSKKGWLQTKCEEHTPKAVKKENDFYRTYVGYFYYTPYACQSVLGWGAWVGYQAARVFKKILLWWRHL